MKPNSLSVRMLASALALSLLSLPVSANSGTCPLKGGAPLGPVGGKIEVRSAAGASALIGFSEFANASTPPKKYRRRTITGTMNAGTFAYSPCDAASASVSVSQSGFDASGQLTIFAISHTATDVTFQVDFSASEQVIVGIDRSSGRAYISTSGSTITLLNGETVTCFIMVNRFVHGGWVSLTPQATMTVQHIEAYRDLWNFDESYNASTGVLSGTDTSSRYRGPSFPVNGGTIDAGGPDADDYPTADVTRTVEATTRTYLGKELCRDTGAGWLKYDGKVTEALSDEDKESDATARARAIASAAAASAGFSPLNTSAPPVAYEMPLSDALEVAVSHLEFRAEFGVPCPGEYDIEVVYGERPIGSGGGFVRTGAGVQRQYIGSGKRILTGKVPVIRKNTEYTLLGIEVRAPCGDRPPGDPDIHVGSIHVGLGLGKGPAGTSAGEIRLEAETVSSALFTPAALLPVAATDGSVEIVRDSADVLRQMKAPQTFADIVTLDASSYEVRFYSPADVGTQDPVTRIYALTGTPYVTYKFENPDTGVTERLKITETRGASVKEHLYTYASGTNTWSLSQAGGLRQESLASTTAGADTTKITTIQDGSNVVVSKTAKTYRAYAWGEELISEVLDPDGAALTTSYTFYDNSGTDGGAYGRLKQRINPNGSWERHTYDATGRTLKTIRPFLNAAVTAAEADCRVTENVYTTLADADGDTLSEQLTATIESTRGTETGRSYEVEWSKAVTLGAESFTRRSDIRCVTVGAAWDASGNLVTETLSYTTDPLIGRTRRVLNPDGTATLISYTVAGNGEQTTITKAGQPNGTFDDITAGTRTVSFTSAQGQGVGESTTDIASNLTLSSWTATVFDSLGRPTRLDHADGTYETRDYACCGLTSSRDRSGAVTSYQYDALGRQTHVTRAGLTTRTGYDADGRVKTVTRIGSDTSEMIQETNTYDLAGRLTERKDALNRPTGYAEVFNATTGETTRTTTNPDAATRIEITARDGSLLSVAGTAAASRNYDYDPESGQLFVKETLVGPAGATTEWTKTFTDFAGRSYKTVYADNATAQSYFNAIGQLVRQVDPDGVTTLFAYNARGEQEVTAVDLDADNTIDYDGTDRIDKTVTAVTTNGSYTVQRATSTVWETDGQDTPVTVSISDQSVEGLRSWQTVRGQLSTSVTVLDGSGGRTVTTTGPDGVKSIQVYANDRLTSATVNTAADVQLAAVTYGYDPHGRQQTITDARNGATTFAYFADDAINTVTTPDPDAARSGPGYDPQTTTYHYDSAGRSDTVTQPDGTVVNTTYWPTGAVKRTWGSRTYPTEYTYDPQGRVKTLTTWQNFATTAGAAVTTWNYHSQRGWLENKRYNDNTGPGYTYKASGRLQTRVWARTPVITTTYGYNAAGDLQGIDYSDSTPDVSMTYDRLGRPKTMSDASGSRTLGYDSSGQLKDEDYTAGLLNTLGVHRTYDSQFRLESVSAISASSALNLVSFGYDAASRLDTVTAGTNTATYAYVPNSPLVGSIVFQQGGTTRLTTVKTHDKLNRLASITNTPSSALPAPSFSYDYNSANQRTRTTREDNARWDYTYDALGQVTSGKKVDAVLTPLAGHDFEWTYDDIGNRKTATANAQTSIYSPTLLNTYSQRTVPGALDVLGAATATSTVTVSVNSGTPQAVTRQGELFFKQLTVANASAPSIKVTGVKNLVGPAGEDAITEITRTAFVPATPEVFTHDADGNLTADARWTYSWDGENRLITMETSVGAVAPNGPLPASAKQKLEFAYDGQGRRFEKKVYNWNGTAWVLGTSTRFIYDGWNLLADLNALNSNAVVCTYVWGTDLSGSMQGAGGVGGLLFTQIQDPGTQTQKPHGAVFDGNGNVIGLVDMATGAKSATYEYNAFGETLISDGIAAAANTFRFSTKYADNETGLLYYGLRYYDPGTGRWINRDPIAEVGGNNLYAFAGNNAVNHWDLLGMAVVVPNPRDPNDPLGRLLALCKVPCAMLREFISDLAKKEVGKRYLDALTDSNHLWSKAYSVRRPDLPGTWVGHRDQFNAQKGRLQRAIDEYNERCTDDDGEMLRLPEVALVFPERPLNWRDQFRALTQGVLQSPPFIVNPAPAGAPIRVPAFGR